jgi:hypothetical protein
MEQYFDLLIQRLHEHCGQATDLNMWYSLTVFDISCDLAFGESLGCLKNQVIHVSLLQSTKLGTNCFTALVEVHTDDDEIATRHWHDNEVLPSRQNSFITSHTLRQTSRAEA